MQQNLTSSTKRVLKILLIEDDDTDARILEIMSRKTSLYNFQFTRVNSFQNARDIINSHTFDLYIVDYWLHGSSTFGLLSHIFSQNLPTPTILLSSITLNEAESLGCGRAANMQFLSKSNLTSVSFEAAVDKAMTYH